MTTHPQAISHYRKASEVKPSDSTSFYELGKLLLSKVRRVAPQVSPLFILSVPAFAAGPSERGTERAANSDTAIANRSPSSPRARNGIRSTWSTGESQERI